MTRRPPIPDCPALSFGAAEAAAAVSDFVELKAGAGGLLWVERDAEGRSTLWHWRAGRARCLSPAGTSVGSQVYGYGGGSCCFTLDGVAYVDEADQQIRCLDGLLGAEPGRALPVPRKLSDRPDCRYGDLVYDTLTDAVLAVEEQRCEGSVTRRLVSFAVSDGLRREVAQGADHYAAPTVSPDGRRLAWLEWDRPELPWTATRLGLARRDKGFAWRAMASAEAEPEQALQQPRFSPDGRLHVLSDRAGWWQPYAEHEGQWCACDAATADHADAPWQLGGSSYLPLDEGLLACRLEQGVGRLVWRDAQGTRTLAEASTRFRQLCADAEHLYAIAEHPERLPSILALDRVSGEATALAGGGAPLPAAEVSRPEPLRLTGADGEPVHAFFYPPRTATGVAPALLVSLHGGPTSASHAVFDAEVQFWTQRGLAVAALNYRGSSGFGRDYRLRLRGAWGVVDVQDVHSLVNALNGRFDPARLFIRGVSAGGFTALAALAGSTRFRAATGLYGLYDPQPLAEAGGGFLQGYLRWLIGDPQRQAERFRARAPLPRAEAIDTPVLLLHGACDPLVPVEQAEALAAALTARGVAVEQQVYPGEGHGWRSVACRAAALEREWRFYQRWL